MFWNLHFLSEIENAEVEKCISRQESAVTLFSSSFSSSGFLARLLNTAVAVAQKVKKMKTFMLGKAAETTWGTALS